MSRELACPHCGQVLQVSSNWPGINFCRGLTLLPWIANHPGLSAWELAQVSGMAYSQVSKGVMKLRDLEIVRCDPEPREAGGFRYRYYPWTDHDVHADRLQAILASMKLPVTR